MSVFEVLSNELDSVGKRGAVSHYICRFSVDLGILASVFTALAACRTRFSVRCGIFDVEQVFCGRSI